MKFFAILLCIAIGSVSGELQRGKFGKEKLEFTDDVNEVRSPISVDDGKSPYSSDESIRGKYDQDNSFDQIVANTKDADSVEKETPRNPSPVIETSTVKPTSSKAIKKNLEILYIRKPARKEANLVSNSRRFLRRKRMAEVEDPTNIVESYKMYKKVREKLPAQLRMKTRKTDTAEEKLLKSYATSNGDTSNLIADYNSAKSAERKQLKVTGSGATEVIDNYKALRKGKPWNYIKLRGKLKGFFGKPSPSLTEYETSKQDEVASIDSFLGGSSNTENEKAKIVEPQAKETPAEEKAKTVEPQEKEKPAEEKATNAQPQEKEKPAEEKTTNAQPQEKEKPAEEKTTNAQTQEKEKPEEEKATNAQPQEKEKPAEEKTTNAQTQEKEKPAEEKATNAQPQEKETPSDEKDWLSTDPVDVNPVKELKGKYGHYFFKPDSMLFNASLDDKLKMDDTNEINWLPNKMRYYNLLGYFDKGLRHPMEDTNNIEFALMDYSVAAGKFRKAYLDLYYEYRKKEIEALKAYLASKPEKVRERVLLVYKALRKGKPWAWMKTDYDKKSFFSGIIPKPAMDKFLAVKKEELYTDQYLDGSMKIGEVSKNDESTKAEASEKPSSQNEKPKEDETKKATEGEKPKEEKSENPKEEETKKAAESEKPKEEKSENPKEEETKKATESEKPKEEQNEKPKEEETKKAARAEEDEKAEEMERGVRAKETETVEVEYDAYRENVENIVVAKSDDAKEDVEVHGSPDKVTSADVTNTETTTHTKTKDNSHLLRFAILLAMVSQVIIAILILAPQRDKLVEWCTRKKRTAFGPSETEPLQAGEKVFATGPTSKVLKVSSQRHPDVSDAGMRTSELASRPSCGTPSKATIISMSLKYN